MLPLPLRFNKVAVNQQVTFRCVANIYHQLLQLSLLSLLLILSGRANALFQLESTGIIMEETEGRVDFNVTNTSSEPILLVTKLQDLDKMNFSKQILISPPITRINPGKTQQVNFVLKKGVTVPHEVLLKASFEGVGQVRKNSAKLPVRQDVGFLIEPSSLAINKTPWDQLKFTLEQQQLVISNPSKYVIRMAPNITLLPGNQASSLPNFYILPNETLKVNVTSVPSSIKITPLSRYGFKLDEVTLPIKI